MTIATLYAEEGRVWDGIEVGAFSSGWDGMKVGAFSSGCEGRDSGGCDGDGRGGRVERWGEGKRCVKS